ncbi:MAG TPA: hypothetical protein VJ952_12465 [Opitutales bacterium]|nr:hypothetical protein [Opitutales bacterium]
MPVILEDPSEKGYLLATYTGRISEDELLASYRAFFDASGSTTEFRELCDLSDCDMSEITLDTLKQLSGLVREFCARNAIEVAKRACYVPREINHSIMKLYSSASKESVEETRVFSDREAAIRWLIE